MMRLFSVATLLLWVPPLWAADFSAEFTQLLQSLTPRHIIAQSLTTEHRTHGNHTFERAAFTLDDYAYRLVVKNRTYVTFSAKKKADIAFSVVIEKTRVKRALGPIENFISSHRKKLDPTSDLKTGYTSILTEDQNQQQPDTISTANVLSWNRLLKDAYQGNVGSSISGGAAPSQADASSYDHATSMAKMMNQCGGNKSQQAHRQAMQNIAQALVLGAAANSHQIARASQGYAEQSKNYQRHGKESVLEVLEKMKHVNPTKLFQALQAEKRKIEKSLQRNEISYVFTSNPVDQNSLRMLKTLIQNHSRIKTLTHFQYIGRNSFLISNILRSSQHNQPGHFFISRQKRHGP